MSDAATPSVHDLLLALAGRLDDDLLAWARELAAVGEQDQAVELATAALAAERVVLPPTLRAALVAAARAARTDLNVERALPPGASDDGTPHRFDAAAAAGGAVVAALTALPARRLSGCTLHLTWRRTPAGAAPGPLPRAVLLVEADPDRSADVLAYLLATELERAGAPASVEVFAAGSRLPAYHVAALRAAREIVRGAATPDAPVEPDVPAVPDVPADESDPSERPAPAPLRVVPAPTAVEAAPERVADVAGAPDPLPAPPDSPAGESDPLDHDPLSGPLRAPLMAPLLEPMGLAAQPATPDPEPVPGEPEPIDAGSAHVEPVEQVAPAPTTGVLPDEWADEWRSGDWAMPPTGRSDTAVDLPGPDGPGASPTETAAAPAPSRNLPSRRGTVSRRPGPVRARPAEGSLFDSPTNRVGSAPPEPHADRPEAPEPQGDDPLFGPMREVPLFGEGPSSGGRRRRVEPDEPSSEAAPAQPDPSGQLTGTERDLLAQLQAELAARQRPARPYRRAGRSSGTGAVNGHGHADGPNGERTPPDLAG